jgi:hypothetical protein
MNTTLVQTVAAGIFTHMAKDGFVVKEVMDNSPAKQEERLTAAIASSIFLAKRFEKSLRVELNQLESDESPAPAPKVAFAKKAGK